jgi:hypothetical protein
LRARVDTLTHATHDCNNHIAASPVLEHRRGLGGTMRSHRTTRPRRLSPRSNPDNFGTLDDLYDLLKDNLGKAHAFIKSAEHQMEQAPSGDDEEDQLRQSDCEHLVEAGKLAVRAAIYTVAEIDRRRSE